MNKYVLSNCASNLYVWHYHCSICFSSNLRSKRRKAEYAATKLSAQNMQWRLLWWTFHNILLTSCGYLVANGYTTRRKAPQISAYLSYFICQFGFIQTFGMISFAIWHGSGESLIQSDQQINLGIRLVHQREVSWHGWQFHKVKKNTPKLFPWVLIPRDLMPAKATRTSLNNLQTLKISLTRTTVPRSTHISK